MEGRQLQLELIAIKALAPGHLDVLQQYSKARAKVLENLTVLGSPQGAALSEAIAVRLAFALAAITDMQQALACHQAPILLLEVSAGYCSGHGRLLTSFPSTKCAKRYGHND